MLIPVEDALEKIFGLISPLPTETIPLAGASGRVLARAARAERAQPPFAASAMDGYAICDADARQGTRLRVADESAAGASADTEVMPGIAVRIFTGAPVPTGAHRVVIQENVSREGNEIVLTEPVDGGRNIRPAGADFAPGDTIEAPRRLRPADLALLAAMNIPEIEVFRRPDVALLATGDELVMPGETPGPDQIIASNAFGLKALAENAGARARMLPIAPDDETALRATFDLAQDADLIVTIGGASVGDHDLVGKVAAQMGLDRAFYKVAMRPGKPLMAGILGNSVMLGLPGNPVSSMVCGHVFMQPALLAMQGLPKVPAARATARLASPVTANGPREHYMRARVVQGELQVFDRQDSALLSVLSQANALLVRPPHDKARAAGCEIQYLPI